MLGGSSAGHIQLGRLPLLTLVESLPNILLALNAADCQNPIVDAVLVNQASVFFLHPACVVLGLCQAQPGSRRQQNEFYHGPLYNRLAAPRPLDLAKAKAPLDPARASHL